MHKAKNSNGALTTFALSSRTKILHIPGDNGPVLVNNVGDTRVPAPLKDSVLPAKKADKR